MNIEILILKAKLDKTILKGIEEFEKRLSRYCKIKRKHFKTLEQLLNKAPSDDFTYQVDIHGDTLTSEDFSEFIDSTKLKSSRLTFIVGAETDLQKLCLSHLEFSTDTSTLILYEQIYRAFRIMNNEPYHK